MQKIVCTQKCTSATRIIGASKIIGDKKMQIFFRLVKGVLLKIVWFSKKSLSTPTPVINGKSLTESPLEEV